MTPLQTDRNNSSSRNIPWFIAHYITAFHYLLPEAARF